MVAASLAGVITLAVTATTAIPVSADSYSDSATLLNDMNLLRAHVGVASLALDNRLTSMAQGWVNQLAGQFMLAQNPSLAAQAPAGWVSLGENVGAGPTAQVLFNALAASPEHYANMVNSSFNSVGVAVAYSRGMLFVVEDFMQGPTSTAVLSAASAGTAGAVGGYRLATQRGDVLSFGASGPLGNGVPAVAGMAATPDGRGYWLATSVGAGYRVGVARF